MMNKTYISSVSPKYQVTIPKEVRAKFNQLKPFTQVEIFERGDEIILKPKKSLEEVIDLIPSRKNFKSPEDFNEIRKIMYKSTRKI